MLDVAPSPLGDRRRRLRELPILFAMVGLTAVFTVIEFGVVVALAR